MACQGVAGVGKRWTGQKALALVLTLDGIFQTPDASCPRGSTGRDWSLASQSISPGCGWQEAQSTLGGDHTLSCPGGPSRRSFQGTGDTAGAGDTAFGDRAGK